jgi:hypothetical protein
MAQLHETLMGRKLIESTLPRIADALEEIARQLKLANREKEEQWKQEAYWEEMERKLSEQRDDLVIPF